jgi:hypothetical protein
LGGAQDEKEKTKPILPGAGCARVDGWWICDSKKQSHFGDLSGAGCRLRSQSHCTGRLLEGLRMLLILRLKIAVNEKSSLRRPGGLSPSLRSVPTDMAGMITAPRG